MHITVQVVILFTIFCDCLAQNDTDAEYADGDDDDGGTFGILVVGGTRAEDKEFPHMVALGYGDPKSPQFLCGGSLISEQFVLTAAHCTEADNIGPVRIVRIGTNSVNSPDDNAQEISVADIIVYRDYKPPLNYHDIALLKLEQSVNFTDHVLPARLQFEPELDQSILKLTIAGWGSDNFLGAQQGNLLRADLDVVGFEECNKEYRPGRYPDRLPRGILNGIQICAGGLGKDSCQGDSGGPLEYTVNKQHHIIVGITSIGKACGLAPAPGVYTRVSAYFRWIQSVVWP